jgi:PLP dependent protein
MIICSGGSSNLIKKVLSDINRRILETARKSGRDPSEIRLVAVTKTVPIEAIRTAFGAGQTIFGENRVQEALQKVAYLSSECEWHLIGHLQSNKVKQAVKLFSLIHSIDSISLAEALHKCALQESKIQKILIQVNISGESSKFGVNVSQLPDLVRSIAQMSGLQMDGLMTIPPLMEDPEQVRSIYRELKCLSESLTQWGAVRSSRWELSMGMSHDYEVAVQEGATLVRIGTAIFGNRNQPGRNA